MRERKVKHLVVCRSCLRTRVLDWVVLGTAEGKCELCGAPAYFQVYFAVIEGA